jgi:adenylate kinase
VVRVLIMGVPGAGKGTQAKLLEERFGVPHVSTGDMLRAAAAEGTALGGEARRYMDDGALVPDDVMIGLVAERLAAPDCAPGFVLDGFPRTVRQAKALDRLLAGRGQALDAVLHIAVPHEEAIRRLGGRWTCRACGSMSQVPAGAPGRADRCTRCGGDLVQREDDREPTIRHRMKVYGRDTAPVLEHYRKAGLLREVSGAGTPEEVFRRVAATVGNGRS